MISCSVDKSTDLSIQTLFLHIRLLGLDSYNVVTIKKKGSKWNILTLNRASLKKEVMVKRFTGSAVCVASDLTTGSPSFLKTLVSLSTQIHRKSLEFWKSYIFSALKLSFGVFGVSLGKYPQIRVINASEYKYTVSNVTLRGGRGAVLQLWFMCSSYVHVFIQSSWPPPEPPLPGHSLPLFTHTIYYAK